MYIHVYEIHVYICIYEIYVQMKHIFEIYVYTKYMYIHNICIYMHICIHIYEIKWYVTNTRVQYLEKYFFFFNFVPDRNNFSGGFFLIMKNKALLVFKNCCFFTITLSLRILHSRTTLFSLDIFWLRL